MEKYKVDYSKLTNEEVAIRLETLASYCSSADYLDRDAIAAICGFEKIEGDKPCTTGNALIVDPI